MAAQGDLQVGRSTGTVTDLVLFFCPIIIIVSKYTGGELGDATTFIIRQEKGSAHYQYKNV